MIYIVKKRLLLAVRLGLLELVAAWLLSMLNVSCSMGIFLHYRLISFFLSLSLTLLLEKELNHCEM